jgi:hypothetical protein
MEFLVSHKNGLKPDIFGACSTDCRSSTFPRLITAAGNKFVAVHKKVLAIPNHSLYCAAQHD